MFQVRIHGRGGQGVVTAAEILSVAAFVEGRHAQAFPSFGSERMGAPVVSFCRIDDDPIRTREPVMEPDALIVQDVTLIHQVDLFAGLSPDGYVLVNTARSFDELGLGALRRPASPRPPADLPGHRVRPRAARSAPPNAALLGGFAALTGRSRSTPSTRRSASASRRRRRAAMSPPPRAAFEHVAPPRRGAGRAAPD